MGGSAARAPTRRRLIHAVQAVSSPAVMVIGGSGYGKSRLAVGLAEDSTQTVLVRSSTHVELDALRAATEQALGSWQAPAELGQRLRATGVTLLIDPIDDAPGLAASLAEAAAAKGEEAAHSDGPRIVVFGRVQPDALSDWPVIGPDTLAFTPPEVKALLATEGISVKDPLLWEMTGGWPAAVDACAQHLAQSTDGSAELRRLLRSPRPVTLLLDELLDGLDDSDNQALIVLARMKTFDDRAASIAGGPDLIERVQRAGVSVAADSTGLLRVLEPVASHLARNSGPVQAEVSALVAGLTKQGRFAEALRSHLGLGDHVGAAKLLAGLRIEDALEIEPDELVGALTSIGDAALIHPRCLQVCAQCLAIAGRQAEGMPLLERSQAHLSQTDPEVADPAHIELLTEIGVWHFFMGRQELAARAMRQCEQALDADDRGVLRARFFDLRGLLHTVDNSNEGLMAARADMSAALGLWRQLGETRSAVLTGVRLANNVLVSLGRRDEALTLLESLEDIGSISMLDRGRVSLLAGMMMPFVGRAGDVAHQIERTRNVASALDLPWMGWWADWAEAVAASTLGDTDRVIELADRLAEANAAITTPTTTAAMWTDIAEALARCGQAERAQSALNRALALDALEDWYLDYAEASILARVGDPEHALERLDVYRGRPDGEPEKRWSAALLEALANHRLGNTDGVAKHVSDAHREAMALGQPRLPEYMESALLDRVDSTSSANEPTWQPAAGGPEPGQGRDDARVLINIFGDFLVEVDGTAVHIPDGRPATLLKLLATNRGRIVVDQAIDVMWPEADLELGRQRIRNVVRRVRTQCGDALVRSGDTISLAGDVTTDLALAHAAAQIAQGPDATTRDVENAVRQWRPELLSANRYDDWAEEARRDQAAIRRGLIRTLIRRYEADGTSTDALHRELDVLDQS